MSEHRTRRITHSIVLLAAGQGESTRHIAHCSCGWDSEEYHMKSNLVMDLDWLHPAAAEQPLHAPEDR